MKIRIIRLSHHELSVKLAHEAANSVSRFGLASAYFEGVRGDQAKVVLQSHGLLINPMQNLKALSDGTLGCLCSHMALWRECAKSDEPFVIMEHDGVMVRDPTDIVGKVHDVCRLDRSSAFSSKYPSDSTTQFEIYEKQVAHWYGDGIAVHEDTPMYGTTAVTGPGILGAYAYCLTPQGANKLLAFAQKHGVFPADRLICKNAVTLQVTQSTYIRLNPLFNTIDKLRALTTR